MSLATGLALVIFPAAMLAAGFFDARTRMIPNRLVLAFAASFLVVGPLAGLGWAEIALHGLVALGALAFGFGLYAAGWLGGGDGKLIAATVLWLGPAATPAYLIYAALAGGALAVAMVTLRLAPRPSIGRAKEPNRGPSLPYGVALAAGGLLAFAGSFWGAALT